MKSFRAIMLAAGLGLAGAASAAMPLPIGAAPAGTEASSGLLQEVQYRGRGRPRCFIETRRVRFIDRFGRPSVRIVERRVCR